MNLPQHLQNVQQLLDIMALLRSDDGCPWDREQTPETLKKHILEEACELIEAIDSGDSNEICDELGDLLLQVVFQAQIFSERDQFGIAEISQSISNKLIRRHPHIFSDASYDGHEQRWEEIKRKERSSKGKSNDLAQRIPRSLPALQRATKLAGKFPCGTAEQHLNEIKQTTQTLKLQPAPNRVSDTELTKQLSELLFSICKLSAAVGIDPEDLLRQKTTQRIAEIDSAEVALSDRSS